MVSRAEWYERTNALWPEELPELTDAEAIRAAKKLYRFVRGKKIGVPVVIAQGNVITGFGFQRGGKFGERRVLKVNPRRYRYGDERNLVEDHGWEDVVHGLSHAFGGGHSKEHARLEASLVKEVLRRGWLQGALKDQPKPEQTPVDERAVKAAHTLAAIKRWEAKAKRAENALKKLRRRAGYYQRAGVSPAVQPAL